MLLRVAAFDEARDVHQGCLSLCGARGTVNLTQPNVFWYIYIYNIGVDKVIRVLCLIQTLYSVNKVKHIAQFTQFKPVSKT